MRVGFVMTVGLCLVACSGAGGGNATGTGGIASGGAGSDGGGAAGAGAVGGGSGGIGVGGSGGNIGLDSGLDGGAGLGVVSSLELERVWYLASQGANSLVDFRVTPPQVTCGAPVGESDGFEGTGVFTDPKTAELYFYTDGRKVFHGTTHQLVANGDGLSGDVSSTEAALIAPKFGSDTEFYIFTNSTNVTVTGTISYSIMDLSVGASGTVTTKNQPLVSGNVGEALDLVPHANGESFWVLAYDGAATLQAFEVTKSGVSTTPVKSPTGLSGQVLRSAINHTLDYDTLVLAMNFGGPNGLIATASFDRQTGTVSNVKQWVTGDVGYHAFLSPDATKLYYVRGSEGWWGVGYQLDLLTNTETLLGGTLMAAARLAPDGKLYWASNSYGHLGVVAQPDAAGAAAGFDPDGLYLEGCTSGFGLPNQTASYLQYLPPIPE